MIQIELWKLLSLFQCFRMFQTWARCSISFDPVSINQFSKLGIGFGKLPTKNLVVKLLGFRYICYGLYKKMDPNQSPLNYSEAEVTEADISPILYVIIGVGVVLVVIAGGVATELLRRS